MTKYKKEMTNVQCFAFTFSITIEYYLRYDGYFGPEVMESHVSDVSSIYSDVTYCSFYQSEQSQGQGRGLGEEQGGQVRIKEREMCYLWDDGYFGSEVMESHVSDVSSIYSNVTHRSFYQSEQSQGEAELACSCSPHYPYLKKVKNTPSVV